MHAVDEEFDFSSTYALFWKYGSQIPDFFICIWVGDWGDWHYCDWRRQSHPSFHPAALQIQIHIYSRQDYQTQGSSKYYFGEVNHATNIFVNLEYTWSTENKNWKVLLLTNVLFWILQHCNYIYFCFVFFPFSVANWHHDIWLLWNAFRTTEGLTCTVVGCLVYTFTSKIARTRQTVDADLTRLRCCPPVKSDLQNSTGISAETFAPKCFWLRLALREDFCLISMLCCILIFF